jgi:hypothetical protein
VHLQIQLNSIEKLTAVCDAIIDWCITVIKKRKNLPLFLQYVVITPIFPSCNQTPLNDTVDRHCIDPMIHLTKKGSIATRSESKLKLFGLLSDF